jgi:hypothetical protein
VLEAANNLEASFGTFDAPFLEQVGDFVRHAGRGDAASAGLDAAVAASAYLSESEGDYIGALSAWLALEALNGN